MPDEAQAFVAATTEALQPRHRQYTHALWQAATTGTQQAIQAQKDTQAALMHFWADSQRYARAKQLLQSYAGSDPILARQLKLIFLSAAKAQQDEATIEKITELEAKIRSAYYTFRPEINAQARSDNELDDILRTSTKTEEVQQAWAASKRIGGKVAQDVRLLARVRNQAAQEQGYRDHFQKMLLLNEIDETELFELFQELDRITQGPYGRLKEEIDQARAGRFGLSVDALRPWHYGDRFFQAEPELGNVEMDGYFSHKDPVQLAIRTYDGLGLDVRAILDRSDLYARPGKNQHAFCLDLDRQGDVRTLNNLQPTLSWTQTLLHELGHAVYDQYVDPELPWLLRRPAHTLTTEALALLMGALVYDLDWLINVLEVPQQDAGIFARAGRLRQRAGRLIFTRWTLVMTHFERALYADPDQDLDRLWWDLVERFQYLVRPEGRHAPDWAAKYHLALAPVYYQNYQLGHLLMAQIQQRLLEHVGGITDQPQAGEWLQERVIHPGSQMDWAEHVVYATGEPLNPHYFVDAISV